MTELNERDFITPDFGKEPKLTKCEHCKDGYVYEEFEGEVIKEDCPECDNGWIEIDD